MQPTQDEASKRQAFSARADALVGCFITEVSYWDVHDFGPDPRVWDYGDWHHAVLGVELLTNLGPRSIMWTNAFFPYGAELLAGPITEHLHVGSQGPQGWRVEGHREWQVRLGTPVRAASYFWELIQLGPSIASDGAQLADARSTSVPVALRLDFDAGPVWMVAGIPQLPDVASVFIPGNEIMVVFSAARMHLVGFPDTPFTRT